MEVVKKLLFWRRNKGVLKEKIYEHPLSYAEIKSYKIKSNWKVKRTWELPTPWKV